MDKKIIRVFPRRTKATPEDEWAFVGAPSHLYPPADEVHISCTFTWDMPEAEWLYRAWSALYPVVKLGGPAFNTPAGEFIPGLYLKTGYVITSRGCPRHCPYCLVPAREGPLRLLPITFGWDVSDNNLLACPRRYIKAVLTMMEQQPKPIRFTGGLEASRVTKWFVNRLVQLNLDIVYLAYDHEGQRRSVERAAKMILDKGGWGPGYSRRKVACYVLVGYNEDLPALAEERLEWVRSLGIHPFPMYWQPERAKRTPSREWQELIRRYIRPWIIYSKPPERKEATSFLEMIKP